MHIEGIRLKNFKAFADVHLVELPRFCVLVGENGVGKTTFFDVFGFLKDCLTDNVRQALGKRGGFSQVVTRGHGAETIEIELQVRMEISGKERLVTYALHIALEKGLPVVQYESLRYKRGRYGAPFNFLKFIRGEGEAITNEEEAYDDDLTLKTEHQKLGSADILAIKGLGQFEKFRAANAFRNLIENWHVSDFDIEAAKQSRDAGYAEHISADASNISLVTQFLYENHPEIFDSILDAMKRRVPGVADVKAAQMDDGRIVLKFQDGTFKDPFIARYVSDGTIKMFAYLILLHDPSAHPLLCVEEPENQLYPNLLDELAEEFAAYTQRGGQVFVSTHSPDFLNAVPLNSILVLEKNKGVTSIRRAANNKRLQSYVDQGDKPGWLWRQGAFEIGRENDKS